MTEPDTTPDHTQVDADFVAEHVGIAVGRKYLTKDGVLFINEGNVALIRTGDEPVTERIIAVEPVGNVEVVAKPWWSFGTGMSVLFDDTKITVEPNAIYQGSGFATLGKIRRARETVRDFEAALAAARHS